MGSIIIFHLSKLWKATFSILCDVIFLGEGVGEIWCLSHLVCWEYRSSSVSFELRRVSHFLTRFSRTLLPDKKGKSKFKTPFVKRNLNPSFDYKFVVEDQSVEDLKSKVLEITLWDHDLASSDEFLGGVRLGLGTSSNPWDDSNTDEAQIWQTILSRHNVWVQVVLRLRAEMKEGHKLWCVTAGLHWRQTSFPGPNPKRPWERGCIGDASWLSRPLVSKMDFLKIYSD